MSEASVIKISVSMPEGLRRALGVRAEQQKRSVSAHLQFLVEKDLKSAGVDAVKAPEQSLAQEVGA